MPAAVFGDLGFLSLAGQLKVQDPFVARYDEAARSLPRLIESQNLSSVESLPGEIPDGIDPVHLERLKMAASFLAQAYVWAGPQPEAPDRRFVPKNVAAVLVGTGKALNEPPMFNYADNILRNWLVKPGKMAPFNLHDLDVCYTFTGLADERNFDLIHVLYEFEAVRAIRSAMAVIEQTEVVAFDTALARFATLRDSINEMRQVFDGVTGVVSPRLFRDPIRVFLMGWRGNVEVVYLGQDVDTDLRGETGAQSSAIPLLDSMLGIADSLRSVDAVHGGTYSDWIDYMPATARELAISTPHGALAHASKALGKQGEELLDECIGAVRELRARHLTVATRYLHRIGDGLGTGGTDYRAYLSYTTAQSKGRPKEG